MQTFQISFSPTCKVHILQYFYCYQISYYPQGYWNSYCITCVEIRFLSVIRLNATQLSSLSNFIIYITFQGDWISYYKPSFNTTYSKLLEFFMFNKDSFFMYRTNYLKHLQGDWISYYKPFITQLIVNCLIFFFMYNEDFFYV